jgi:hypothetical protein
VWNPKINPQFFGESLSSSNKNLAVPNDQETRNLEIEILIEDFEPNQSAR